MFVHACPDSLEKHVKTNMDTTPKTHDTETDAKKRFSTTLGSVHIRP